MSLQAVMRNPCRLGRIEPKSTMFFCCDVQERFRPLIHAMPSVVAVATLMSKSSQQLKIPFIITEQYPKGLGKTVPEIEQTNSAVFEKTLFSMLIPPVAELVTDDIRSVVLFGIEAHVCILQTTLDLLQKGIDVHVLVDGTSSQRQFDRTTAFNRMRDAGAFLTTSESILLQLASDSTHPNFKAISALLKEYASLKLDPDIAASF